MRTRTTLLPALLLLAACASDRSSSISTEPTTIAPAVSSTASASTSATVSTMVSSTTAIATTQAPSTAVTTTAALAPSTAPAVIESIDPGDGGAYAPQIDPARFTHPVDNPYLPFLPGAKWVYQGINEDGDQETTTTEVLAETRVVMGVTTTVVHDVVSIGGAVVEDTKDWYAQDDDGNVWYFGEDTTAFDSGGGSSKEGSWEAGRQGAFPGIVMPAHPQVSGTGYRQEYLRGTAEDTAIVVAVGGDQSVGGAGYHQVVVTEEWSPLEPDIVEQKSYAPGVGLLTEDLLRGGTEHSELVSFSAAG